MAKSIEDVINDYNNRDFVSEERQANAELIELYWNRPARFNVVGRIRHRSAVKKAAAVRANAQAMLMGF